MFPSLRKFTIKSIRGAVCSLACASSLLSCATFALAQSPEVLRTPTPAAATAQTAVPALIPYSGVLETTGVKTPTGPANMTFLIYKDEQGGEPLWAGRVPDYRGRQPAALQREARRKPLQRHPGRPLLLRRSSLA